MASPSRDERIAIHRRRNAEIARKAGDFVQADALDALLHPDVCDECGFVAKSKAGLAVHQTSHATEEE